MSTGSSKYQKALPCWTEGSQPADSSMEFIYLLLFCWQCDAQMTSFQGELPLVFRLENQLVAKKWLWYSRKQYSFDSLLILCQIRYPFHQHSCWPHPANMILIILNDFLVTEWCVRERITVCVCVCGRVCSIYFVSLKTPPEKVRIFSLCVVTCKISH